jgi:hypothetical protein
VPGARDLDIPTDAESPCSGTPLFDRTYRIRLRGRPERIDPCSERTPSPSAGGAGGLLICCLTVTKAGQGEGDEIHERKSQSFCSLPYSLDC